VAHLAWASPRIVGVRAGCREQGNEAAEEDDDEKLRMNFIRSGRSKNFRALDEGSWLESNFSF